jgi:hypothetical protein
LKIRKLTFSPDGKAPAAVMRGIPNRSWVAIRSLSVEPEREPDQPS